MSAPRFGSIDALLLKVLRPPLAGRATVANRRDATLTAPRLPFVEVYRYGGADDTRDDSALVSLTVFGTDPTATAALAEDCRTVMLGAPYRDLTAGRGLDRVGTLSAPVEVPYGDGRIYSWAATYRVVARPTSV